MRLHSRYGSFRRSLGIPLVFGQNRGLTGGPLISGTAPSALDSRDLRLHGMPSSAPNDRSGPYLNGTPLPLAKRGSTVRRWPGQTAVTPVGVRKSVWASPTRPDTGLRCLLIVPGLLELFW
jgi:hypothetical protein